MPLLLPRQQLRGGRQVGSGAWLAQEEAEGDAGQAGRVARPRAAQRVALGLRLRLAPGQQGAGA